MEINALLIIVFIIMALCIVIGVKRGFIHTVFYTFSLLIVILLTGLLSPYVADYITNHMDISKNIRSGVEDKIRLEEKINISTDTLIKDYVDKIDLPDQLRDIILDKCKQAGDAASATTQEASKRLIESIYQRITELIVSAIAYLFTFAVMEVVVLIAGLLLDIVAKLPGIKQANEILGGIIGFLQGYLIVSVLYIAAMAFAASSIGTAVIEMVKENSILTWFYEHNFIVDIVFGMLK
jgi:uncharacterized membrane protein required for colicin V production